MKKDSFLEFQDRQGYRIVTTESCHWYNAQAGFFFYYPYHKLITPTDEELKLLFKRERCIGVRYFTPMDQYGKESFMFVCSDKNYDFVSVDKHNTRRQTRRGLENLDIRQIEFKDLAVLGLRLNHDTLVRQGRAPRRNEDKKWRHYCSSAVGLEGFEAWGAFTGNNLASFLVAHQLEDEYMILHQSSATKHLCLYPNNALTYYVTNLKLTSMEINTVHYGPQSLEDTLSLDKFKLSMGFQKKPMKQAIVFNPLIKPFINGVTHRSIKLISALIPRLDAFRKIEGIIRYYHEAR